MKPGIVDADRFKVDGRQSVNGRKISNNSLVLNGADENLNYAAEDESVVRQVILAAAYHDHISCTKSANLCQKVDGAREGREALPCETDHIYANCSESKNKSHTSTVPSKNKNKKLTIENTNLRTMLITDLDMISQLREELEQKKEIFDHREETEMLKACLQHRERAMCLLYRNYSKSDKDNANNSGLKNGIIENGNVLANGSSTVENVNLSRHPNINTPATSLATRYFGRRSKTVPSRALKRRYMGPPKSLPTKKTIVKVESSTASISSASEVHDVDQQEIQGPTQLQENGTTEAGIRRVRKRRGRKPKKVPIKTDYLTTDKAYFVPDFRSPTHSFSSSQIDVPSWRLKPVTSFYQMEEQRWDAQRSRDTKTMKKKRSRNKENSEQRMSHSFQPDPLHIEYIEVTEQLPVMAFGHPIPLFAPCEFSLPWLCEDNLVKDPVVKAKRGRPCSTGPKVT
ncbi:PEHE domain-containing protein [Caerostris extrusa]|uniref:PEHE domain-containing protein n=1 Tax=Caerostris extrusa TaxID=172846 RepID=A0AAV4TLP5_CAEEX|nr:PEHE domain-containing protein [Caerostris extrusa]